MKVTYNWLKEFVEFDFSPAELAEKLTMLGLEVENTISVSPTFQKIVVGKILEIQPHPNANSLLLCKVDIGTQVLNIVCGAHNIKDGDYVPVAVPGAKLSNNRTIAKRTIRSIESEGMLCSEIELGIGDDEQGIFILSKENMGKEITTLGISLEEVIELNDTIYEINVTPNRSDALSILGIGREIAGLIGKKIVFPNIDLSEFEVKKEEIPIKIEINTPQLCPRYTGRIITNLKVKQSPFWLRYRLRLLDARPINNVVDITNYILYEMGQPLHAFDLDKLHSPHIIVRTASAGEKIRILDQTEHSLEGDELIIADPSGPIALAGIMGGESSEVSITTTNILLESAYFYPIRIRQTSKRLGVQTESSYRFERGIDPNLPPQASNRASYLLCKLCSGIIASNLIDISYKEYLPSPKPIKLSITFCNSILGTQLSESEILNMLSNLNITIKKEKELLVIPPSYRLDLTSPIDITEEIARLYGYNNISYNIPEGPIYTSYQKSHYEQLKKLKQLLIGYGLKEIISYSFINPEDIEKLKLNPDKEELIFLKNPVSTALLVMRPSLLPGLITTLVENVNKSIPSVYIFEVGNCFKKLPNKGNEEEYRLGICLYGSPYPTHWTGRKGETDFYTIKGLIEYLLDQLHISTCSFSPVKTEYLHPGRSANLYINETLCGVFGELSPLIAKAYDLPTTPVIGELSVQPLLNNQSSSVYKPLPRFPGTRRDISIVVDNTLPAYDIIKVLRKVKTELVEDIKIFDLYKGTPLPEGKKSVGITIFYRAKDHTITDKEVEETHQHMRDSLVKGLPCEIRS